jgi:hypothetical protein
MAAEGFAVAPLLKDLREVSERNTTMTRLLESFRIVACQVHTGFEAALLLRPNMLVLAGNKPAIASAN